MAHPWRKLAVLATLMGALIACSKSDNNGGASSSDYLASYEAADGCTTGRQVFSATTETDIANKFCDALKDQTLNKNCAPAQREQAFKIAQCSGSWPLTTSGNLSTNSQQYAFKLDNCSTGVHVFVASTSKALNTMLCKALNDDSLNRSCAKDQRMEMAKKNKCADVRTTDKETDPSKNPSSLKTSPTLADASQNPASSPSDSSHNTEKYANQAAAPFKCGTSTCDPGKQYCLWTVEKAKVYVPATAACQDLPKECSSQDGLCLKKDVIAKSSGKCTNENVTTKVSNYRQSARCVIEKK